MSDSRVEEALLLLDPPSGVRLWFGGATLLGSLRGVDSQQALWRPSSGRRGIWELVLHLAYWKYAVRRVLEGGEKGGFSRKPANFPALPDPPSAAAWRRDRDLLRAEHERLLASVRSFDPNRWDQPTPGKGTYRFLDLVFGVVTHDVHHVAQIQLLKRLQREARR